MRGKDVKEDAERRSKGITPAYAGKSRCQSDHIAVFGDHPRVCGEKHDE